MLQSATRFIFLFAETALPSKITCLTDDDNCNCIEDFAFVANFALPFMNAALLALSKSRTTKYLEESWYLLTSLISAIISSPELNNQENIPQDEINKALAVSDYSPIILERGGVKLLEFMDFPPFSDVESKIATQNQTFKMGLNKIEFKNKFFNLGEKTTEENETSFTKEAIENYETETDNSADLREFGVDTEEPDLFNLENQTSNSEDLLEILV